MPTVRINGVDVEVPRHVHRADGTSKIVLTEEACVAACADGWHPVPPSADAPTVDPEPVASSPVVYQDGSLTPTPSEESALALLSGEEPALVDEPVEDDKVANQLHYVEPQTETNAAPAQRKRGRPRKVQP